MHQFDEIDLQLIELLQTNSRIKRSELADKVNLTVPAVSERINKLEEKGLIKRYTAQIDFKKAGYDVTAFIFVFMESSKYYHSFTQKALHEPEILECHSITGEGSHILKVVTENTSTLEKILSKIQAWPGVTGTKTNVVLSTIKDFQIIKVKQKER
ncbi:MAG: Lrp/AsnC family transcriptional regulator [Ignavibacteria bacterium]|nr:Lrp/AsnC family transcriptional regulator [Ignavibacteria bacterium]